MRHDHVASRASLLFGVGIAAVGSVSADDRVWLGLTSDFHDPAAWADGIVPDETDTAIFPASAWVEFNRIPATVDRIVLRNGESIFDLTETSLTALNPSLAAPGIVVGPQFGDACDFQIRDGLLHVQNMAIGWEVGATGRVQIGEWYQHSGALRVDGHLGVGQQGEGEIDVQIGTIDSAFATIGMHETAMGIVTMGGPGVAWTNDLSLTVGKFGHGSLHMSLSAQVETGSLIVAHDGEATGEVVVEGDVTALHVAGDLDIGLFGEGSLTVRDGAVVTVGQICSLGLFATFGYVDGQLVIIDSAAGDLIVDGETSSFACFGQMYVGEVGRGTVTVTNGGVVSAPAIQLHYDDDASIGGDGLINADIFGIGLITPGAPIGELTINGDVGWQDIELEFAGPSGNEADRLVVNGELSPYSVHLHLADGFVPQAGHSWEVITAGTLNDTFDYVNGDPLPVGLVWQLTYSENTVVVTIANETPADVNNDGVVDAGDLAIVLGSWGQCAAPPEACPADVDQDGIVGPADLAVVLGNWG